MQACHITPLTDPKVAGICLFVSSVSIFVSSYLSMYLSTEAKSHRSQEATEAKKPRSQKPRNIIYIYMYIPMKYTNVFTCFSNMYFNSHFITGNHPPSVPVLRLGVLIACANGLVQAFQACWLGPKITQGW